LWLSRSVIAVPPSQAHHFVRLHLAPGGGLRRTRRGVRVGRGVGVGRGAPAGSSHRLRRLGAGLPAELSERFPHLRGYAPYVVPDAVDVPTALRGQLAVSSGRRGGAWFTGVQIAGVLDGLYAVHARQAQLGVMFSDGVPSIGVWAPTARRVWLHRFADADCARPAACDDMILDPASGVWSCTGDASWNRQYYVFEVEVFVPSTGRVEHNVVTDPYAVSLSARSDRAQIVDLRDADLAPQGWEDVGAPRSSGAGRAIYELHVRDFSIADDSVPPEHRGTYLAFTHERAAGMTHLRRLATAGLTAVHLLPTFDIATLGPRGGFNWGYDPLHHTTPEGSYATDPDGTGRILEYRRMVQALDRAGLGVVSDVVYNHMHAAGQDPSSVLDRIVPGYYHRLLEDGTVATSTCCPNTASEHVMMERLMVDSVVTWARTYRVQGFRFDLMAHHTLDNLRAVRAALDALELDVDGVDGPRIHLYGEGWNFGEVANDARFVQAGQRNLAGTGIGTFNDRLRDAVRGGGPFDEDPRHQGFASGLAGDPAGPEEGDDQAARRERLLLCGDQIRVGLAGNLAGFRFVDRTGTTVSGADVPHGDGPTGYTSTPAENVLYVSAHDNETLYDALAWKLPVDLPMAARVRMQLVALSFVALGQGVAFFHAGCDLLRSKSFDRNSYDSGDLYNALDWTQGSTRFGVGLPPGPDNEPRWRAMRQLLADPRLQPAAADIAACAAGFRDLLRLRRATALFALPTAASVQQKLSFENTGPEQVPGVIVMHLDDTRGDDLDPALDRVVVVFNATPTTQVLTCPGPAGARLELSPVQATGSDPEVRRSTFDGTAGTLTVPGRTTAVFVEPS
jgi:pullulanase/glycogen debranching enzyme